MAALDFSFLNEGNFRSMEPRQKSIIKMAMQNGIGMDMAVNFAAENPNLSVQQMKTQINELKSAQANPIANATQTPLAKPVATTAGLAVQPAPVGPTVQNAVNQGYQTPSYQEQNMPGTAIQGGLIPGATYGGNTGSGSLLPYQAQQAPTPSLANNTTVPITPSNYGNENTSPVTSAVAPAAVTSMPNIMNMPDQNAIDTAKYGTDGSKTNTETQPGWGMNGWGGLALGAGQMGLGIASYMDQRKTQKKQRTLMDQQIANNASTMANTDAHRKQWSNVKF